MMSAKKVTFMNSLPRISDKLNCFHYKTLGRSRELVGLRLPQSSHVPLECWVCWFASTIPRAEDGHILNVDAIRPPSNVPKRAPRRPSRSEKVLSRSTKCSRFLYLNAF
jgi:hypothetical protein